MPRPSPLLPVKLDGSALAFIVDNIADTVIRPSPLHGHGLFTTRPFEAGEIIVWLDGQVVTWDSFSARRKANPYGKDNDDLFMEWNALSPDTLLIRPFRTKYSFINHSRTPNAKRLDCPLRLVAASAIDAHTELTFDYREEPLNREYIQEARYL